MVTSIFNLLKRYLHNYRGLPSNCSVCIILTFIDALAGGVSFFLSVYFVEILHIDLLVAGFLLSIYGVGTICGGYIGGRLSDICDVKFLIYASFFTQAVCFLWLSYLGNPILIGVSLFIVGFATYAFKVSNSILLLVNCAEDSAMRLKVININRVASNLGLSASGILIGLVGLKYFALLFKFAASLFFVFMLYFMTSYRTSISASSVDSNNKNQDVYYQSNGYVVTLMTLCIFFVGLILAQLGSTYPLFISKTFPEYGMFGVSFLFILDTVIIVILQAPLVNYFSKHNKVIIVGTGAVFIGLGMSCLIFAYFFTIAIVGCIIVTIGEMLFVAMAQVVCYENQRIQARGSSMGTFQSVYALSAVFGPTAGSYIYEAFGPSVLWGCCGSVGVIIMLICYLFSARITNRKQALI